MASQKMRLEAEMKDNASPAIKALRAELSALQATSADTRGSAKLNDEINKLASGAAVDGSAAVRKLRAELADLQKATAENRAISGLNKEIAALKKGSGEVAPTAGMKAFNSWMGEAKTAATGVMGAVGGFAEVLGPIGIGAVGAGAAVSGLASEMKRLGEQSLAMKELSRQTAMSLDFVNRWSHAGEHFGVAGDAMRGMLDRFAGQIPDFNRGVGSMFKEFSIWPDVVRKMQSEAPADALMDAFRQIEKVGRVRGPEVQKQVLESMGLGPEAEKLFMERLAGFQKQLNKPWAMPSQDLMAQAQALRDAGIGLNNDFERLENIVAPGFLKVLKEGVNAVDLLVKGWVWEFQKIADLFDYLGKSSKEGAKAFDDGEKRAIPAAPNPNGPALNLPEEKRRRNDGQEFGHIGKKASYDGGGFGGLRQNASFETGADPTSSSQFGLSGIIADGTKAGVLAAFRDWSVQSGADKPGSRGGFTNASYGDGDGESGAGGGGGGRRGFMLGGREGGGGRSGRGIGAEDAGGDASEPVAGAANPRLAGTRKKFFDELDKNPQLRRDVIKTMSEENNGSPTKMTAVLESMVNRARMNGYSSLNQAIHSGFYGPVNHGALSTPLSERDRRDGEAAITAVRGGSNTIGYRTDQGMLSDPGAVKYMAQGGDHSGHRKIAGEHFFYMGQNGRRWAQQEEEADRRATPSTTTDGGGTGDAVDKGMSLLGKSGAAVGKAFGVHITPGEWCAEFVNGALKASGIEGTNSAMAGSFSKWGKEVAAAGVKKGDVVVDGEPAGHVSLATGATRMRNGHLQIETLNGNWGHSHGKSAVKKDWLTAEDWVHVRRAEGLPTVAAAPHPDAGRRANGLGDAPRERQDASEHRLTIALHDPGGHVKSTRIERNGPLKVEMPNRWQTGRNPLIGA